MNDIILKKISKWKNYSCLEKTNKEELFKMNDEELFDAFYKDLEFGTGGMRGVIGPGTNRMNIYTLRAANYGYAMYLKKQQTKNLSVVIAYDCRRKSLEFAIESARVLCHYGIKVYLFDKITPTPELSFAVRYLKTTGGIVITASHNPPQYNGYKIYDSSGCQLVPDLAQIVIDEILSSPDPFEMELIDYNTLLEEKKIEIIGDEIDEAYLENVKSIACNPDLDKSKMEIVFTSLHGTSAYLGQKLLQETGYKFTPVKEQMVADSEFSTLKSPNPEDPKAFDLGIKYAKDVNADIIIATDPDADRVGLAVKNNDEYVLLNGNQTGALLIYYLVNNSYPNKKGVVFNTIVTSSLGAKIAESYGLETFSTLTGFKYIGEQAKLLENSVDKVFYFGYEESYGYVIKDFVRDKDSLQALLMCSEMCLYYKLQGKNLLQVLDEIYQKYGYYVETLENIVLTGAEGLKKMAQVLSYFREIDSFDDQDLKVVCKEDYYTSISKDIATGLIKKIELPQSDVIKYILDDGSWFVLRPSGTEPKMKLYVSSNASNKDIANKRVETIKMKVLKLIEKVI